MAIRELFFKKISNKFISIPLVFYEIYLGVAFLSQMLADGRLGSCPVFVIFCALLFLVFMPYMTIKYFLERVEIIGKNIFEKIPVIFGFSLVQIMLLAGLYLIVCIKTDYIKEAVIDNSTHIPLFAFVILPSYTIWFLARLFSKNNAKAEKWQSRILYTLLILALFILYIPFLTFAFFIIAAIMYPY